MNQAQMTHPVVRNMVEIELVDNSTFGFRKVVETLTRMGIMNDDKKVIHQSAHIFHKRGRYYIAHFKEMMMLDGKSSTFDDRDRARRNRIALLLERWGMIRILDREEVDECPGHLGLVAVLKFADKDDWTLNAKYNIGSRD